MKILREMTARACLVLGVCFCAAAGRAADKPAELTGEYLAQVRDGTRQLIHDLDQLQQIIIAELKGEKVRDLYRRADIVLAEAQLFEGAIKTGAGREDLYQRYAALDDKLHELIKALEGLGADQRALHRAANYLQATDDQLHFLLSAGDPSEARMRQVVERQARALAATADEMVQTANYALGEVPGRDILLADIKKFAEEARRFQQNVPALTDRQDQQRAFAALSRGWEKVVEGMKNLPPRENVFLLRSAVRIDHLHERLHRLLGIGGERKGITVRT